MVDRFKVSALLKANPVSPPQQSGLVGRVSYYFIPCLLVSQYAVPDLPSHV